MMKRAFSVLFSLVCLLSISEAASKKPKYFNLYNELVGSWNIAKTVVSISTGEILKSTIPLTYNFTKGDVSNELLLEEYDTATKEEKRKPYQVIVSVKSNFTATVNRFEPGADVEVIDLMNIHFNEFLREEVYVFFIFLN